MEGIILLDTSVLIDFLRKKNKAKSFLFSLLEQYTTFQLSVISKFEVQIGKADGQDEFWKNIFAQMDILPLNEACTDCASVLHRQLKAENKLIGLPDLLIAATAITYNVPLATLNVKHFERIKALEIITPQRES